MQRGERPGRSGKLLKEERVGTDGTLRHEHSVHNEHSVHQTRGPEHLGRHGPEWPLAPHGSRRRTTSETFGETGALAELSARVPGRPWCPRGESPERPVL